MKILAQVVFEGIVYNSIALDLSHPCRPTLDVDALLRPGDADAASGPLLLPVADYIRMLGIETARPCLEDLAARGRVVQHLDVDHITFPTWSPRACAGS
ncbi:MAG TPA: hypothetical protein VGZ52_09895 [Acidimicrobiales bacterium]|nr:hypothetical protein [Acidimicrobiales bacterium]